MWSFISCKKEWGATTCSYLDPLRGAKWMVRGATKQHLRVHQNLLESAGRFISQFLGVAKKNFQSCRHARFTEHGMGQNAEISCVSLGQISVPRDIMRGFQKDSKNEPLHNLCGVFVFAVVVVVVVVVFLEISIFFCCFSSQDASGIWVKEVVEAPGPSTTGISSDLSLTWCPFG